MSKADLRVHCVALRMQPSVSRRPLTVHEGVQLLRVGHSAHPFGQLVKAAFAQFVKVGNVLQQSANVVDGDAGQLAQDVVRREAETGGLTLLLRRTALTSTAQAASFAQ